MLFRSHKFKVIPNPISFQSLDVSPLNQKRIVSLGRLVAPKGFQLLIKAFACIVNEFPDWEVCIYGSGRDKEYLDSLIKKLALTKHVFIHPPVKDVQQLMQNASLCVLPSRYEGFGLVLVEAMACGVPCVAFDCECGPSEIIRDGEDGLIAQLDNLDSLAEKMRQLMTDNNLRAQMGKQAKTNMKRYSKDAIMDVWQSYFQEISNSRN